MAAGCASRLRRGSASSLPSPAASRPAAASYMSLAPSTVSNGFPVASVLAADRDPGVGVPRYNREKGPARAPNAIDHGGHVRSTLGTEATTVSRVALALATFRVARRPRNRRARHGSGGYLWRRRNAASRRGTTRQRRRRSSSGGPGAATDRVHLPSRNRRTASVAPPGVRSPARHG